MTANDVCRHGYTKEVRSVSTALKREVCRRYGVSYPTPHGAYEIDHFIPLELGGSNDVTNLWPEPANPRPGFHEKDVVENYLHREVCKGRMTLKQAQEAIRNDWYAVYLSIPRKK
ncbi:MAG: HNH endonuclease [Parcubacteria group bacterium]|nr:HNH endonuclease [Parcubacteria group bacterium]